MWIQVLKLSLIWLLNELTRSNLEVELKREETDLKTISRRKNNCLLKSLKKNQSQQKWSQAKQYLIVCYLMKAFTCDGLKQLEVNKMLGRSYLDELLYLSIFSANSFQGNDINSMDSINKKMTSKILWKF